jgi:RNA polymerase sigma factor (TIGR02999 family)
MPADPPESADQLVGALYDELRVLARSHLRREQTGHTLDTTGLVNEAYLRLVGQSGLTGVDRSAFFGIASNTMRRVLVDHARARKRLKRGGGEVPVSFDDVEPFLSDQEADELLALNEALDRLTEVNPRGSEVVQLRFFAGLGVEEVAQVLGVSSKTVQRDWLTARAWLRKEVAGDLLRASD